MPYATSKGVHQIDAPLSNLSVRYANDSKEFVADKIFSTIPVAKESDAYYVFGKDNLRLVETARGDGAPANEIDYQLSTTTYNLTRHSVKELVTDRQLNNADAGLDLNVQAMENCVDRIQLRKEVQLSTLLLTTTAGGGSMSLTSTLAWNFLTTTSDPIGDVSTATTVIKKASAKLPNTMVVPYDTYQGLRNHPNILERIKYSERGIITESLLQSVFDIPKIIVGSTIRNTGVEGGTDALSMIWDASTWIGYINPSPGLRRVSAGYNFVKSNNGVPYQVKRYRDEEREGNWVEVSCFWDAKLVATSCAYVIKGTDV